MDPTIPKRLSLAAAALAAAAWLPAQVMPVAVELQPRFRVLQARGFPTTKTITRAVELHDFDRDGDVDLMVGVGTPTGTYPNGGRDELWLNDGHGNFSDVTSTHLPWTPTVLGHDTWDIAIGDVDGDGDPDVVMGNMFFSDPTQLWLNDGSARFTDVSSTHVPFSMGYTGPGAVELADMDGDGDLDLLVASYFAKYVAFNAFANDGTGHFTEVTSSWIPWTGTIRTSLWDMDVGDIDGDGDPDVVLGSDSGGSVWIATNDGTGVLRNETAARFLAPLRRSVRCALGDVDADGDLDLVVTGTRFQLGVREELYLNDGKGYFRLAPPSWMPAGGDVSLDIELADLDEDGDLDLIVANGVDISVPHSRGIDTVYLNDGTGRFTDVTSSWLPAQPVIVGTRAIAVADVDGDRDPDLVFGTPFHVGNGYLVDHLRQHSAGSLPRPGGSYRLEFEGEPGLTAIAYLGGRTARIPVMPYGVWGLDPAVSVLLPGTAQLAADRRGSLSFPIPNDPRLSGRTFYTQGVLLDPANPPATRVTPVLKDVVR